MSFVQILILSLIQGITEFLPISSTAHLILLGQWIDHSLNIEVALHLGTLLAVLIYFWQDIWFMTQDTIQWAFSGFKEDKWTESVQLATNLILITIPALIIGFILKKFGIDVLRQSKIIGFSLIIFGILLYLADMFSSKGKDVSRLTPSKSLAIGVMQTLAFIPGASRSGLCITAARFAGLSRKDSAKLAFLASIPVVLGAAVLSGYDLYYTQDSFVSFNSIALLIGLSMVIGLLTIQFLLNFLIRYSFLPFCIYRIVLGVLILAVL